MKRFIRVYGSGSGSVRHPAFEVERRIELPYPTTNKGIFGEVQLKDESESLAPGPGLSPDAIALGPIKSTTATLSVSKRQKCQKIPTFEGPDYCHPAGLVNGVRIFFKFNRLLAYGYFDAIVE